VGVIEAAKLADQVEIIVGELAAAGNVREGQIIVFGVSTSEVIGQHIGTSGTEETARGILEGIRRVQAKTPFLAAFQCCEHLNRAIVVERQTAERYGLEPVSVIPVPKAGGSMAAFAYRLANDPVVVESISAHAGIDIGDTLIGMHLRRVAVPFRPSLRRIGEAHVNAAFTRPKLIGGARAVYEMPVEGNAHTCE
jgi:uncharacterized protein (TIGR01440 family)